MPALDKAFRREKKRKGQIHSVDAELYQEESYQEKDKFKRKTKLINNRRREKEQQKEGE